MFQSRVQSEGLVHEIGRRNRNFTMTASECFALGDEYAGGESNVVNLRGGKGKEPKWDQGNQSGSKNNKRKADSLVAAVGRSHGGDRPAPPSKRGHRERVLFKDLLEQP